ncbi:MAG: PAP/fibrillin family protein [Pseudanabaenaceae cyanobacterium]
MSGKAELLELVSKTDRGLQTNPTLNKAILAAIARLEDRNPTPQPTASPELEGNWELLFTTSQGLLGLGRIPLAKLGTVYQCVRLKDNGIYNIAEVYGLPWLEGVVSVSAKFAVSSARRIEVNFQRSVIGFQKLLNYRNSNQGVDDFIRFLETGQQAPAFDFRIRGEQRGWLEITYLDADLRIGRGNEGNVFVLRKVKTILFQV